jgi:hypothetical protein
MAFITDYQHGNYASEVDDANLKAIVRDLTSGKVVKRFSGESAWADAQREVSDLALADMYG